MTHENPDITNVKDPLIHYVPEAQEDQDNIKAENKKKSNAVLLSQLEDYSSSTLQNNPYTEVLGADNDADNDPDPYSNTAILAQIRALFKSKGGNLTNKLMEIFSLLTQYFDNQVGQDGEAQTAMNKYVTGASGMERIFQDTDGHKIQQVNPYTGKPEFEKDKNGNFILDKDGNKIPQMDTPENVMVNEAHYLMTDPGQKYKLDDQGHVLKDKTGKPIPNPAYKFFKNNPDLYDQIKTDIQTQVESMSGTDKKVTYDEKTGFFTIPGGIIKDIHDEANPQPDPKDPSKPVPQPNLTRLNAWNTGAGNTTQTYTNTSAAGQAVMKTDTQAYQAANSTLTKGEGSVIDLNKAFVQGQKTS